ncbi:hypothetical protein [Microbacterium imperiale]|uniref:Uncharacterized protein n=1 Tax=Microbacterium imperiale TaxID=33884 RepID=A0A9W6HEH2_9MICO|nr:hypothetical protein [Microbacterium imperiale]MBP2420027.1 outer membrane biosynthesis protein TonB [Microbacterium imperiale]MDS0198110.1 hypothetical protein [Microbacterium imperiale]BFE40368.1 hypothetical protein GCM10017544_13240 [Microbacterium imperiale]GLJ78656.1 hypothetical protein GCM10017586_03380 [Microbacterium imperiale]
MSLFESSNKGLKFDVIGTTHTGTVKSAPRERQQTKYGTQEPDFWPNGDPKMQILVDLQTDQRADAHDDGERTLYVASKNMKKAIGEAIRAAQATDIMPGGVLTVTYVGNDPASKNPANPAKLYQAQYTAPASGFVQQPAAPAQAPQQPAYQAPQPQQAPSYQQPYAAPQQPQQPAYPQQVQQPYQAPQAAPQPEQPFAPAPQQAPGGLTQDQVNKLQQLRAAGIPADTIATAIGATQEQITAFDNTPF